METIKSGLFKLNSNDFIKGAITAVFVAVVMYLSPLVNSDTFVWNQLDWGMLFNAAVAGFIAYLSKNFMSDKEGRVLGRIG